jgi:hypothetical protein
MKQGTLPHKQVPQQNTTDPNAMEIDQRKEPDQRKCFMCQKEGHLARNCTEKNNTRRIKETKQDFADSSM